MKFNHLFQLGTFEHIHTLYNLNIVVVTVIPSSSPVYDTKVLSRFTRTIRFDISDESVINKYDKCVTHKQTLKISLFVSLVRVGRILPTYINI